MAKLALLFIVIFCIVQICLSVPIIKRDTESTDSQNSVATTLESEFAKLRKQFEEQFTKENLDKLASNFKELGDKIQSSANEFLAKIDSNQAKPTN